MYGAERFMLRDHESALERSRLVKEVTLCHDFLSQAKQTKFSRVY
jgi:hypothetical protein